MRACSFALSALLLCGCIISPDHQATSKLTSITHLSQLAGTYRDSGVRGPGAGYTRLSFVIWPDERWTREKLPERIRVEVPTKETLVVTALTAGGEVVKTQNFVRNRDFKLSGGTIVLEREAEVLGFKSGEPLLGAGSRTVVLALDSRGNGVHRESQFTGGLVFLFLPVVVSDASEVRFERISE